MSHVRGGVRPLLFLSYFLAFAFEQLPAQTAFVTEYQPNQVGMATAQTNRYNLLQNDSRNQDIRIVSTADVRSKQVGGKLSFLLPGLSDSLHVEATLIRDDASGFSWSGKILNKPGYASFLHLNGLTSGFIQVSDHFYELMPMGASYQFLVERKPGAGKNCGNPGTVTSPPDPGPDYCTPTGDAYNTCPALVYMLLVITPAAKTYIESNYSSINDFVLQGQNQINLALANSDIPNKEVAIKWIEKDISSDSGLDNPVSNTSIGIDRDKLPILLEPERTNYKADVAFLITQQNYPNAAGAVTAFGPQKNRAYGIVEANNFINQYVIAHEFAHLLGCHHNWPVTLGDDNEHVCAHGYRWIEDLGPINSDPSHIYEADSWATLVSTPLPLGTLIYIDDRFVQFTSDSRILHYSNPTVGYAGQPTGTPSGYIADNARQIRNAACEVSDFYPSQDLSVFIQTSNCSVIPFTYSAYIVSPASGLPGAGPYTVTWSWNTSGNFNPSVFGGGGAVLGAGQTLTVYQHPSYPYCNVYWVQCKVVAADGTQITRIKKIDLRPAYCFCQSGTPPEDPKDRSTDPDIANNSGKLSGYPNPVTNGLLNLEDDDLASSTMQAVVSDLSGRVVLHNQIIFDDNGRTQMKISPLPDGFYLLRLHGASSTPRNLKFLISKN